jgi:hypothetical protein
LKKNGIAVFAQGNHRVSDSSDKNPYKKLDPPLDTLLAVDEIQANRLITDSLAKSLIADEKEVIKTSGTKKCIVNVDKISGAFMPNAIVDINKMKDK